MYRRTLVLVFVAMAAALLFAVLLPHAVPVSASPPAAGDPGRGAHVFALNGGCGCHMGQAGFLAGGQQFQGPFGAVYSRNLTPDPDTGLGKWTDQQIVAAIRTGHDNQGKMLFPVMPYQYFSGMADQDVNDLVAFLRTVPPIKNAVPEDQLKFPPPPFNPPAAPAVAPASGVARGDYLAHHVSLCVECHTPTNPDGSPDMSKQFAGGFNANTQAYEPNITPDSQAGIGTWSQEQIVTLLWTGRRPDGSVVGGLMKEVIDGGFNQMTNADAFGVAAYLKSIPPNPNIVKAPTGGPSGPPTTIPTTGGQPINLPEVALLAAFLLLAGLAIRYRYSTR